MNQAIEEIKSNPKLIEELCAGVGQMSMALMATNIRLIREQNDSLRQELLDIRGLVRDTNNELEALRELCRKFQRQTKSEQHRLENHINQMKPAAGQG